jgi:hypothetical protein
MAASPPTEALDDVIVVEHGENLVVNMVDPLDYSLAADSVAHAEPLNPQEHSLLENTLLPDNDEPSLASFLIEDEGLRNLQVCCFKHTPPFILMSPGIFEERRWRVVL